MNKTETTPMVWLMEPGNGLDGNGAVILAKPKVGERNEKAGCAKCYA